MKFAHVPLHTPEQVREIVREAGDIADETEYEGRLWEAVFGQACTLLAARATHSEAQHVVPIVLDGIRSAG